MAAPGDFQITVVHVSTCFTTTTDLYKTLNKRERSPFRTHTQEAHSIILFSLIAVSPSRV